MLNPAKKIATIVTILLSLLLLASDELSTPLKNGGFESGIAAEHWRIESSDEKKRFSVSLDKAEPKEGAQSLLVSAETPAHVTLRQDLFLPVGSLWRLTGWIRSSVVSNSPLTAPQIGIETPVGDQGFSTAPSDSGDWRQETVLFRVPSPGKVTVALNAFDGQAGRVWFDDIRLLPVEELSKKESVTITPARLSNRPIDLKQGGQFIEPLCNLLPSMIAQQVRSTSFEEESPWNQAYKQETDKPYRPWYPDGSVHEATYSYDTQNPFNGQRSQKIELPVANTWAGISQDGFFIEAGHSYRLRLHLRSQGKVSVRASLHGNGAILAGPVSLGSGSPDWIAAEGLLVARRGGHDATLTIEFKGPGTLWLDRIYLIDTNAVLGLWRPDIVNALKALQPGIVRFGGSTIETYEWKQTIGSWDTRAPFSDDPWGGLQENFVGVEEFVQLVQHIGAEPLICVRWTGKKPQDAADEVEYFNGSVNSKLGRLRAANGHPAPYRVKYWQVGNEVGGPEYDASLSAFAESMRQVDPSIKVLSSFPSDNTVKAAGEAIDYLSPHHYSIGDLNGTESNLKWLRDEISRDGRGRNIRVAITEWNTTGGEFGLGRALLLTLGNALSLSRYQNLLHRYSDLVEISNRSNLVDSFGSGIIQPGPGWLYLAPGYYSQQLYQRAAGSFPLKTERKSSLPFYLQEPDLDANLSPDGTTLRIYAVNSTANSESVDFHLDEELGSIKNGQIFVLADRNPDADSEAMNSRDDPHRVGITMHKLQANGVTVSYKFSPFSVTLLELALERRTPAKSIK